MGNNSSAKETPNFTNYGVSYNPYGYYGNIENYGTYYQPYGQEFTYIYVPTNELVNTEIDIPPVHVGRQGLRGYGRRYHPGFIPMIPPGSSRSKVRYIFMPDNIVYSLQNLLQQRGIGMINPSIGGLGNMGAFQYPQMNPLMPLIQAPIPQMGPNYLSSPSQLPPIVPPMPFIIPAPPPMIQPIMPQMPMCKSTKMFFFSYLININVNVMCENSVKEFYSKNKKKMVEY